MSNTKNDEKKWPINPKQLITDRASCEWCRLRTGENDNIANNGEKCCFCGFVTEDYLRGILYSLYEKVNIPIVLFERICCPSFNYNNLSSKEKENKYFKDGNTIYHKIDAANIYQNTTFCFACRKNKRFAEKCSESDLAAVKEVYRRFDTGDFEKFNTHKISDGTVLHYYEYECSTTTLKELAFPIVVEGNLVAVAIVGQIVLEKNLNKICQECLTGKMNIDGIPCLDYYKGSIGTDLLGSRNIEARSPHNNTTTDDVVADTKKGEAVSEISMSELKELFGKFKFSDVKKAVDKIGPVIKNFQFRMSERCKIRSSDFLYTKQGQYLTALTKSSSLTGGDNLYNNIINVFEKIQKDFSVDEIIVFLPDYNDLNEHRKYYKGKTVGSDETETRVVLPIFEIPLDKIQNGKIKINDINEFVDGYEWDRDVNKYEFFAHLEEIENTSVLEERCGIAVLIKWSSIPKTDIYNSFFNVILDTCFALVMTQVARIKQNNLSVFRETTRHDLSQQLAIIGLHSQKFKENIIKYDAYEMTAPAFRRSAGDYQKEIDRAEKTLQHFTGTLEDETLIETYKPTTFLPYSMIIFNLKEQYNSKRSKMKFNITLPLDYNNGEKYSALYADPHLVERMLVNLADNAFKYAFSYSNIYLKAYYNVFTKEYIFEVMNFGNGIEQGEVERIFNYGYRSPKNEKTSGSGFGLYNVRRFVEMHDGSVMVSRNELISNFNIPAMHRFERMLSEQSKYQEISTEDKNNLDLILNEKNRMQNSNKILDDTFLYSNEADNDYDVIVFDNPLTDSDSLRSLRRQINKPTYCVAFEIRIPQGKEGDSK